MKRVLQLLVFAWVTVFVPIQHARADTYNVNAVVPYATPSVAATFDSSLGNLATTISTVRLYGTCQIASPSNVVVVMRGSTVMGSTACVSGGTYSLDVDLSLGANSFVARTVNLNGVYGPDSTGAIITYAPSVPSASTSSDDLSVQTSSPFVGITSANTSVSISVVVGGGSNPYSIEINWGDGSVEKKEVAGPGTYSFDHSYSKLATYQAKATVTDVLGVSRVQLFAVIAPASALKSTQKNGGDDTGTPAGKEAGLPVNSYWFWPLLLITGVLLGYFIALSRLTAEDHWFVAAKRRYRERLEERRARLLERERRWATLLVVGIALLVSAWLIVQFYSGPSIGITRQTAGLNEVKGAQIELKSVVTRYFSASIPSTFELKTSQEIDDRPLFAQYLYAEGPLNGSRQIGITLGHRGGLVLEELPFVHQRTNASEKYRITQRNSSAFRFMTITDDEYTLVALHDEDYVAISASGQPGQGGTLQEIVEHLYATLQWR